MGTGWRRAFCTSIRRDPGTAASEQQQHSPTPSPRSCVKLNIFSGGGGGGSNPSTPRLQSKSVVSTPSLRCRTKSPTKLQCKTTSVTRPCTPASSTPTATAAASKGSPRLFQAFANPSSPRSPSRFALLKTTLCLSRSRCGICAGSVRAGGQRTAVFTAECSHVFHFPCISAHVRTHGCLVCPVCSAAWHEVPLLSSVHLPLPPTPSENDGKWGESQVPKGNRKASKDDNGGRLEREGEGESKTTSATKVYNDDEPLLPTVTSRGSAVQHFNPIPEADDEDGDEEEGGHGFVGSFANDNCSLSGLSSYYPSSRCTELKGSGSARGLQIIVMPEAAMVSAGRSHHNYVIALKVKAPPLLPPPAAAAVPSSVLDPSCRAPIDLVTVLDVSGSMTVAKLQMLKRAMRLVISSLGPADRLSIVAFSVAAAKRLLPLRRMSRQGQRAARQIVDKLVVCGQGQGHCASSSCVGDALRKATKVLEDRRERNTVATIMLLSDGQGHPPNEQHNQVVDHFSRDTATTTTPGGASWSNPSSATRFTHLEIPLHAPPPHLLPQKQMPLVEDAFAKCVNGLVSVVLQDVHLQLVFPTGVISSVYSYGDGGGLGRPLAHGEGGNSVRLGDLYSEEERELLVELRVPAIPHSHHNHQHTLSVRCSYRNPATQEVILCGERTLTMPLLQFQFQSPQQTQLLRSSSSSTSRSSSSSSPVVNAAQQQRLRNLFVTTRAMAESRRLVDLNDLETAVHLLSSARSLLLQHSASISSYHKKLVLSLEAQLADLQWRRQHRSVSPSPSQRRSEHADARGDQPLTPTSAWRAAEQLAKVAIMRKSINRVSDLHGLENARF